MGLRHRQILFLSYVVKIDFSSCKTSLSTDLYIHKDLKSFVKNATFKTDDILLPRGYKSKCHTICFFPYLIFFLTSYFSSIKSKWNLCVANTDQRSNFNLIDFSLAKYLGIGNRSKTFSFVCLKLLVLEIIQYFKKYIVLFKFKMRVPYIFNTNATFYFKDRGYLVRDKGVLFPFIS